MATVEIVSADDDFLSQLPWPCASRIVQLLPLRNRLILSSVCKHFSELVRKEALKDVTSLDVNDLYGKEASSVLAWAFRADLSALRSIAASGHSCLEPLLAASQLSCGRAMLSKLTRLHLDSVIQLQDKQLSELIASCPNLVALALPRCGKLTDASAAAIGSLLPHLREVSCSDWAALTDAGVVALALGCPQLEDVTLDGCFRVGSESLAALARSCPRLRRLSISKSYAVTDAALEALGEHCGGCLEELSLRQCPRVAAVWLLGRCARLHTLDISGCANVTGPSLLAMLSGCGPSLRSLQLNGCVGVDGDSLGEVGRLCSTLEALNARGLALQDAHLQKLAAHCTSLRSLGLAWCTKLTEEGLRPLVARNPEIRDLDIEALYLLTDSMMDALAQSAPRLDRLVLRMCHRLSPEAIVRTVAATEVRSLLVSGVLDEAGTSDLVVRVRRVRPDCNLKW